MSLTFYRSSTVWLSQNWLLLLFVQNGNLEVACTLYVSGNRPFGPFHLHKNEAGGRGKQTLLDFPGSANFRKDSSTLTKKLWGLESGVFISKTAPPPATPCLVWNKCSVNIYWIEPMEGSSSIFSKKLKMLCLIHFAYASSSLQRIISLSTSHLYHLCSVLAALRHPLDSVPW